MKLWECGFKRGFGYLIVLGLVALGTEAQQVDSSGKLANCDPVTQAAVPYSDFIRVAHEIYTRMSGILHLPIREPLKTGAPRSKSEMEAYFIQKQKEDGYGFVRLPSAETLKALSLIPKEFSLDSSMLSLSTLATLGLYDPKTREFYITDFAPSYLARPIMEHELTHALEEQSYHLNAWLKAAQANADGQLARVSVSEGTAMDAMIDYYLRDQNMHVRDIPAATLKLCFRSTVDPDYANESLRSKAPDYIIDRMFFPYFTGALFSQQFLKAHSGWVDLKLLFAHPPVSTQQIMHPDMYLAGIRPRKVALPKLKSLISADWNLIEENVMGEFNLDEVLRHLFDRRRADELAAAWRGDRFATFQNHKTGETMLVVLLTLDNKTNVARLSMALQEKYPAHSQLSRSSAFFRFRALDTNLFLRCVGTRCLALEGASRKDFDNINHALGWTPVEAI